MNNEQMLGEIRDANLNYLTLAQNLIRNDKAEAVAMLGMNENSADMLAGLSMAQVVKLASGNTLLCRFRVDDDMVWSLLTNHNTPARAGNAATGRLHDSILKAGRSFEAA